MGILKSLFGKSAAKTDSYRRTALHYASGPNLNVMKVRLLIALGADVNAVDKNGWTPLHAAAQEKAVAAARLLLRAGAKVDVPDKQGNTALFRAVSSSKGDGAMIQLLRAHGADPYIANNYGNSPISSARLIANFDIAQYFADLPE